MYRHETHRTAKTLDGAVGHERRYKILCANAVPESCEPQKATQIILDAINLESDQYRMGHTKVSDTCCGPRRGSDLTTRTTLPQICHRQHGRSRRRSQDTSVSHRTSCERFASFRVVGADGLFANMKEEN